MPGNIPNDKSAANLYLPLFNSLNKILDEKSNIYGPNAGIYGVTSVLNIKIFCAFNNFPELFLLFKPKYFHMIKIFWSVF